MPGVVARRGLVVPLAGVEVWPDRRGFVPFLQPQILEPRVLTYDGHTYGMFVCRISSRARLLSMSSQVNPPPFCNHTGNVETLDHEVCKR